MDVEIPRKENALVLRDVFRIEERPPFCHLTDADVVMTWSVSGLAVRPHHVVHSGDVINCFLYLGVDDTFAGEEIPGEKVRVLRITQTGK